MNEKWTKFLAETKLRVFDFDDTLVKTDAKVKVTNPDGNVEELTPGEYAVHDIDEENDYDFGMHNSIIISFVILIIGIMIKS